MKEITYSFQSASVSKGTAFIDPKTGAIIGLNNITAERKADGTLNLPRKKEQNITNITAGTKWEYEYTKAKYEFIVQEINFIGDTFKILVKQIEY